MVENRGNFGTKLGVILATAGSAVGLGNVWRFPYMTGDNGGAAFIIIYIACVALLGVPCMISEFIIGRHGAANSARAYSKLANGTPWKYIGALGVLTGFVITGYYIVVAGWCIQYMILSLTGDLRGSTEQITQTFADFSSAPVAPIVTMLIALLLTHFVIVRGVRSGIEAASKLMMPALFVLLVVSVVASCMLPGAGKGVEFLLKPDFSKVDGGVFLSAMGQAFYSLSIGMGCICTYASYFSKDTRLLPSALKICTVDVLVAILAGLMIFPAAFSVGISPDSGPSLVFITLPNVFNQAFATMPTVGIVVAFLFYALLILAAITSLISLHEVSTAFFYEELKISRKNGARIVTALCAIVGVFCSLSFGGRDWLCIGGKSLFDIFDFASGQVMLPLGGFLTCLFIGWYVPKSISKGEFTNYGTLKTSLYSAWLFCVRYIAPVCIVLIFLQQMGVL